MKIIRVQSPSDFDGTLLDVLNSGNPVFVCLFGSEDPQTGESWCEDCVIADPLIRRTISKVPQAIFIECPVGERSVYKNNPTHPYRVHSQIKLTAIPTLIRWGPEGPIERLVEGELATDTGMLAMISRA